MWGVLKQRPASDERGRHETRVEGELRGVRQRERVRERRTGGVYENVKRSVETENGRRFGSLK